MNYTRSLTDLIEHELAYLKHLEHFFYISFVFFLNSMIFLTTSFFHSFFVFPYKFDWLLASDVVIVCAWKHFITHFCFFLRFRFFSYHFYDFPSAFQQCENDNLQYFCCICAETTEIVSSNLLQHNFHWSEYNCVWGIDNSGWLMFLDQLT